MTGAGGTVRRGRAPSTAPATASGRSGISGWTAGAISSNRAPGSGRAPAAGRSTAVRPRSRRGP
ncbi:Hypothetical protein SCLAV_1477 [Streptomyces clavuligerus]|uniref:Uncharacterized protein n=1 Tax=Streptomyces clavuligerus TaxID=1901 RepID=E2Q1S8_STRCL|nr:Hypothetical protein SCLAV_1477 [Streptomyces clavuligerus]